MFMNGTQRIQLVIKGRKFKKCSRYVLCSMASNIHIQMGGKLRKNNNNKIIIISCLYG